MSCDVKTQIISFARERGFIAGICSAEPFAHLAQILEKNETPFVKYGIRERIDPAAVMQNCKSIIAVGASYNKKVNVEYDKCACGAFSLGSVGRDYHIVIREFLESLAAHIGVGINFDYKIFVDTGPLVEREILYRAGLAWRGKNFCAISDELGSMFNCGYMLTDIEFDFDGNTQKAAEKSLVSRCGDCCLCVNACPSGALQCGCGVFKYEKCISYLTQKKGVLFPEEQELIGASLYGCDICQLVCPYNKGKERGEINDLEEIYPRIDEILSLTRREFDLKYRERAFHWRGLSALKRNAEIVNKNLIQFPSKDGRN